MTLPKGDCECGLTAAQVSAVLGDRLPEFQHWMRGQTCALCEGRRYNHATQEYEEACGGVAHGVVTYPWDVQRFIDGRPVID